MLVALAFLAAFGAAPFSEPAHEPVLVEKKWEELANQQAGPLGTTALGINPAKWKHAETENFILHYRRVTEAHKVAREIEFDLEFVAKMLDASREKYARKSHVFIFEDEAEWKVFLPLSSMPEWTASFAYGDELFLNVRRTDATGKFDSQTLAHETTHAVVARIYPRQRWPLWLSEGFAEYMGGASVAARKNQTAKRHQQVLDSAGLSLDQLVALQTYPSDRDAVAQLYESAEKLVRFLMNELPQDRFPKFVDAILGGAALKDALTTVYGDKIKDYDTFVHRYERFSK